VGCVGMNNPPWDHEIRQLFDVSTEIDLLLPLLNSEDECESDGGSVVLAATRAASDECCQRNVLFAPKIEERENLGGDFEVSARGPTSRVTIQRIIES